MRVTISYAAGCLVILFSLFAHSLPDQNQNGAIMNTIAESYVKLALAVGQHDPDYVDAYYGPPEWKTEAETQKQSLEQIRAAALPLVAQLKTFDVSKSEELVRLRHQYLLKQVQALISRVEMLAGKKFSFDDESKALYDSVAPSFPESHFKKITDQISAKLPGDGPLWERYETFQRDFVIPKDKLDVVFTAMIAEARKRTRVHIHLPENENFRIEYMTGTPWGAYNWYKGNSQSLIQINTDLPIYIDSAIDLSCHEGYPGHHVYNVLLEQNLLRGRNWIEFCVYPLFSSESLIAEGTADYGIAVAFPEDERVRFDREVLFPLAGLDPNKAEKYWEVKKLIEPLSYAGIEAGRRYLNNQITREEAVVWLERYALMSHDRAEKRVRFIEKYRSYVINYAWGKELVKKYIEARGGTPGHPEKRWEEFSRLISSPRLPSNLSH